MPKLPPSLQLRCAGLPAPGSLLEASDALGIHPGRLSSDVWTPCGSHEKNTYPFANFKGLRPSSDEIREDGPLFGRTIAFTGELTHFSRQEAAQRAVDVGAIVTNSTSKKVEYLVCGAQDASLLRDGVHSTKMLKVDEINSRGGHIEVIDEIDFLYLLE